MTARAHSLSALVLAVLAGACATALPPAGTARIGPEDLRGGGVWSSGGSIRVAAGLRPSDGQVRLCGAWTTTRQSVLSRNHNEDVMSTGSVWLDGRRLATGLGFMARLPEGAVLQGAEARCVLTGLAWSPELADARLTLRLPPRNFEYDELAGHLAQFRQTGG